MGRREQDPGTHPSTTLRLGVGFREEPLGAGPGKSWEFGKGRGTLTDLQLPLDAVLAAVPVLGLSCIIFGHYLHELP